MMPTCRSCSRTLISQGVWAKLSRADRDRLYHTHAEARGTRCKRCARAAEYGRLPDDEDLAYQGGWVQRGLIRVPTERQAS